MNKRKDGQTRVKMEHKRIPLQASRPDGPYVRVTTASYPTPDGDWIPSKLSTLLDGTSIVPSLFDLIPRDIRGLVLRLIPPCDARAILQFRGVVECLSDWVEEWKSAHDSADWLTDAVEHGESSVLTELTTLLQRPVNTFAVDVFELRNVIRSTLGEINLENFVKHFGACWHLGDVNDVENTENGLSFDEIPNVIRIDCASNCAITRRWMVSYANVLAVELTRIKVIPYAGDRFFENKREAIKKFFQILEKGPLPKYRDYSFSDELDEHYADADAGYSGIYLETWFSVNSSSEVIEF